MKQSRAAVRYAESLFEAAQEQGNLEAVHDDVVRIREVLQQTPDYMNFMANPAIKAESKVAVFTAAFKDSLAHLTFNFGLLLIRKGREGELNLICDAFITMYNEFAGIALATVRSAVELSSEQRSQLMDKVQQYVGASKIEATYAVDPELLGGFVVQIGDMVVDGSLRHQLQLLETQLRYGGALGN